MVYHQQLRMVPDCCDMRLRWESGILTRLPCMASAGMKACWDLR